MTELKQSIKFEVEECVKFQLLVPPFITDDGRKLSLVDGSGHIQGSLPPIRFLVPDPTNNCLINAIFHPAKMIWEVVND